MTGALVLAAAIGCPRVYEVVTSRRVQKFTSIEEAVSAIEGAFALPINEEVFECADDDADCFRREREHDTRMACRATGEAHIVAREERYDGEAEQIDNDALAEREEGVGNE